jgi:hypothetical protein
MITKDEALKKAAEAFYSYLSATNEDEDYEASQLIGSAFFAVKEALENSND